MTLPFTNNPSRLARRAAYRRSRGFTIVELAVTIVIIAILGAVGTGYYLTLARDAKISEALTGIGSLRRALLAKYVTDSRFPTVRGRLFLNPRPRQIDRQHELIDRTLGVNVTNSKYWTYTVFSGRRSAYIIAQARADSNTQMAPGIIYLYLYRDGREKRETWFAWEPYIKQSEIPR